MNNTSMNPGLNIVNIVYNMSYEIKTINIVVVVVIVRVGHVRCNTYTI